MSKINTMTYDDAMNELKSISEKLQDESTKIDTIPTLLNKASELLEYCQNKLRSIENTSDEIINKIQKLD